VTTAAALAVLVVIVAVLAAAVDAGYFRGPLIRFLAARTGRLVQIEGHFEAHLFSLNPRVIAERVTIGNPPWMPAGVEGRHPQKVSTSQRRLTYCLIGVIFVRTTPHRHLTLLDSLLASFAPTMPLVHR
jgi:uncharacterized protein involved in outer membrane biogenesis